MDQGADYRREKEAIKQRSTTNKYIMLGVGILAIFCCFGGWFLGAQRKNTGTPLSSQTTTHASPSTAAKTKSTPITIGAMKKGKPSGASTMVSSEQQESCLEEAKGGSSNWVRDACGAVCKTVMKENKFTGISMQCTGGCKSAGDSALALGCQSIMTIDECASTVHVECETTHCGKYYHSMEKMHLARMCKLGCENVAASACARSTGILSTKLDIGKNEL